MNENILIEAYMAGGEAALEALEEATNAEMHELEKRLAANRRKSDIKAKNRSIPISRVASLFVPLTPKEKKAYKKASSKANRRASQVVTGKRGLNRKIYGTLNDRIMNMA